MLSSKRPMWYTGSLFHLNLKSQMHERIGWLIQLGKSCTAEKGPRTERGPKSSTGWEAVSPWISRVLFAIPHADLTCDPSTAHWVVETKPSPLTTESQLTKVQRTWHHEAARAEHRSVTCSSHLAMLGAQLLRILSSLMGSRGGRGLRTLALDPSSVTGLTPAALPYVHLRSPANSHHRENCSTHQRPSTVIVFSHHVLGCLVHNNELLTSCQTLKNQCHRLAMSYVTFQGWKI